MAITVTRIHPHIGAEIGGRDLREPIDAAAVEVLWRAIDRHAVLVFHGQRITDERLRSFALGFGELEIGRSAARGGRRRLEFPEIGDVAGIRQYFNNLGDLGLKNPLQRINGLGVELANRFGAMGRT